MRDDLLGAETIKKSKAVNDYCVSPEGDLHLGADYNGLRLKSLINYMSLVLCYLYMLYFTTKVKIGS